MSSGKSGSSRRRSGKRRDQGNSEWQETAGDRAGDRKKQEKVRYDKNQGMRHERPKWTPIKVPAGPLPVLECAVCGKPIKDIASAITDRYTKNPVHFDCILGKIMDGELLERGDEIAYIGGGRFGVIHFTNSHDTRNFKIKKILEWEDKESRAEWRKNITDRYSVT